MSDSQFRYQRDSLTWQFTGRLSFLVCLVLAGLFAGCRPSQYRQDADRSAYKIISEAQKRTLGKTEPFTVETPSDALRRKLLIGQDLPNSGPASLGIDHLGRIDHWPEKDYPVKDGESSPDKAPWAEVKPLQISLNDALGVAARNNRDYQARKDNVFRSALALDLEANQFRNLLFSDGESDYTADRSDKEVVRGLANSATASWQRKTKSGTLMTAGFAVDIVRLLTQDGVSSLGLFADATIMIPLLRGAGEHIVTEPLTQAERDVAYTLWSFERFKRDLVVGIASSYLDVMRQLDQVRNEEENYKQLIASTKRAKRLAEAGRLPQIQVDQALQDELRARNRWVIAQQEYKRRLDALKIQTGLPTDANIALDRGELDRLTMTAKALEAASSGKASKSAPTSQPAGAIAADAPVTLEPLRREGGGPMEIPEKEAIETALANRLDLRTATGRVYDAQRKVVVAADALKMGLSLSGSAYYGERRTLGSVQQRDARIRADRGVYSLGVALDLPLERTAERNLYRESFLVLQNTVRDVQGLEDEIKKNVRDALRTLLQARETYQIQAQSVKLAKRRVKSTELFLQAGRAEIRDVLEARESLVSAQNALTAALVNYRVAELELQRDMGVLEVDEKGNWCEYQPGKINK